MSYTFYQWLLFFFIYCFIGWIWECSYVSIRTKKLTNRGFMRGPFLPIYGSGAIVMLIVGLPLKGQPVLMFFAGLICASILEFCTGEAMERLFKVKYWDYSGCFLNVRGHICFKASMAWGVFTILMNYFVHKPIEKMVLGIPANILQIFVTALLIYFVADYSLAFKTAMDLRDVIIAIEKFREELDRMEKRLDVAIAFAEDSREQKTQELIIQFENNKEEVKQKLEERMNVLENKIEVAREKLSAMEFVAELEIKKEEMSLKAEEFAAKRDEFLAQLSEIRVSNATMRARLRESAQRRGVMYRNMIRNNPLSSHKFKDALEEIKTRVDEYKRQ